MKRYRGIEFLFDSVLSGFNCLIILVILLFVVVIAIGFFSHYGLFAIPMLGVIFAWLYACGYLYLRVFQEAEKARRKGEGVQGWDARRNRRA